MNTPELTLDILNKHSASYKYFPCTEVDLAIATRLKTLIEQNLDKPEACPGDIVTGTHIGEWNDGTEAHLESYNKWAPGKFHACLGAPIGNVSEFEGNLYFSTSGGPWVQIDPKDLTQTGTRERVFWAWGRYGVGGSQGIYFPVTVKEFTINSK
jgi:hypothetical protein